MHQIVMPLPSEGFDPTEVAVPWSILRKAGHRILIATPDGKIPRADPRMVTGEGLRLFKDQLMADANGRRAYDELTDSGAFNAPLMWSDLIPEQNDALLLPGGHAQGMRPYLESPILQALVGRMFADQRPVAAICHGVVLAARSRFPGSHRSVLYGRKTTALTRPQEMLAYHLTRGYLGTYYRTYPETTVEEEVISVLAAPEDFERGHGWVPPTTRDSPSNLDAGFIVRDGTYLSARWPGDAHLFGQTFARMLAKTPARPVEEAPQVG